LGKAASSADAADKLLALPATAVDLTIGQILTCLKTSATDLNPALRKTTKSRKGNA